MQFNGIKGAELGFGCSAPHDHLNMKSTGIGGGTWVQNTLWQGLGHFEPQKQDERERTSNARSVQKLGQSIWTFSGPKGGLEFTLYREMDDKALLKF